MLVLASELIVVSEAELGGIARRGLSRDVSDGRKVRLRRGVYVETPVWSALEPTAQAVLRMHALQAVSARPLVFSHWSAAVLHGLPVPDDRLHTPMVTVPPGSGRAFVGALARDIELPQPSVTRIGGLLVTDLSRTVVDIAAAAPFRQAVAVADAALHLSPPERRPAALLAMRDAWDAVPGRREYRKVAEVLDFADGDTESVGESESRVTMRVLRLPKPVLQHEFWVGRRLIARVDFWFPDYRTAGEMDGRGKYVDPRMNGGNAAQVVYAEKRREDEVRALDVRFVRWGWREATDPALLGPLFASAGMRAR